MTRPGTSARLLVVQHEVGTEVDLLGGWLADRGIGVEVLLGHDGDDVPQRLGTHDGLLVLGGSMGAHDDDEHEWLAATRALIARTVADDIPFLGICLGHQLAARALGGVVARNPDGSHIGVRPVALTQAGRLDPLLGGLDGAPAVHYNNDVVLTPPPGAEVLATLPDGHIQALRFGPAAWGVQFHPETSPETFDTWCGMDPDVGPSAREREVAAARATRVALEKAWSTLADRFATLLLAGR